MEIQYNIGCLYLFAIIRPAAEWPDSIDMMAISNENVAIDRRKYCSYFNIYPLISGMIGRSA